MTQVETVPQPEATHGANLGSSRVELVLDSHRLTGELRHRGRSLRLVDVLNAHDGPFLTLFEGTLDDPFQEGAAPSRFPVIHLQRQAILFAVPRDAAPSRPDCFEAVTKVPVLATVLLPHFRVTGNIFLIPDVDPARAPLLSSGRFVPMTSATVVATRGRGPIWREPLVVVNLARALVYAPHVGQERATS